MSRESHLSRPRGNLLPHSLPNEPAKPCMKFKMDIEHYKQTGEIIPLTEPEEFIPPEDIPTFSDWVGNPNAYNEEEEVMGRRTLDYKPTKEELEADEKVLTNPQIMEKYNVSKSTVKKWIHDFGIQRIAIEKEEEEEEEKPEGTEVLEPEPEPTNPSMEEYEKFFHDVLDKDMPAKIEMPEEYPTQELREYQEHKEANNLEQQPEPDPEEKIWQNVELELKNLRQRKHERADKEFDERLLKLFECC